MRKRFAIFVGGENCYANNESYSNSEPLWSYDAPFITEQSTFATEQEAIDQAVKLGRSGFAIMPVYFP